MKKMKIYGGTLKELSRTYNINGEYFFIVILESSYGFYTQTRKSDNPKNYKTKIIDSQFYDTIFEAYGHFHFWKEILEDEEINYLLFAK